ncbi:MAG: hypothetical protein EP301_07375 [Gammaproteobacteria bacterium]|nr:MAG: hypothetical protein EP301_07375 [Gammaproteobacteria bacterium]
MSIDGEVRYAEIPDTQWTPELLQEQLVREMNLRMAAMVLTFNQSLQQIIDDLRVLAIETSTRSDTIVYGGNASTYDITTAAIQYTLKQITYHALGTNTVDVQPRINDVPVTTTPDSSTPITVTPGTPLQLTCTANNVLTAGDIYQVRLENPTNQDSIRIVTQIEIPELANLTP